MRVLEDPEPTNRTLEHPLEAPVWASLTGGHASFADKPAAGPDEPVLALRYRPDVSPWCALMPGAGEQGWAQLGALVGPGGSVLMSGSPGLLAERPAGWDVEFQLRGVQMVATEERRGASDADVQVLGESDVAQMLALVQRTEPGPFERNTYRMGSYLGIRRADALVAMAGERLNPPGYREISAVCTDPEYRGQGLAARVVAAIADGIWRRGEIPCLHAAADNTRAVRLYARMGFEVHSVPVFARLRVPVS